jgi:hypothetical protein
VAKQPKGELVPVVEGFDYSPLEAPVAQKLRTTAERIRDRVKKTLEDIIEIGNDLLAVKDTLPHGQFLRWLNAEFGWEQRTAYNFMSVAERFQLANFASLPIQPSAAYLLAGPSVPDKARELAIERAESGEQITTNVAKEIVAETRKKKRQRKQKALPTDKLGGRLLKVLERYRERWNPKELAELARHLREFADALDEQKGGKKTKKE